MSAFGTPLTATGPATVPFAGTMGQPHPMSMCTPGQTSTVAAGGGLGPDVTPLPFPSHLFATEAPWLSRYGCPTPPSLPSPPLPSHVTRTPLVCGVHCHGQPEGYNVTTVSIAACHTAANAIAGGPVPATTVSIAACHTATNAIAGVPVPCCCVHLLSLWLAFALVASFLLHRLIVAQSSFPAGDRVHPQVRCGAA